MPLKPVRFEDGAIAFSSYPFAPASVRPGGRAAAEAIAEVDLEGAPPAVLTTEGEWLFLPASQREELGAFVERHGLRVVQREDVWMLLLEPFLDTEFSEEIQAKTMQRLAALGLSASEVARIRGQVERQMLTYTAITWEWMYYGLFDVLQAMATFGSRQKFGDFYREAMRLALLPR